MQGLSGGSRRGGCGDQQAQTTWGKKRRVGTAGWGLRRRHIARWTPAPTSESPAHSAAKGRVRPKGSQRCRESLGQNEPRQYFHRSATNYLSISIAANHKPLVCCGRSMKARAEKGRKKGKKHTLLRMSALPHQLFCVLSRCLLFIINSVLELALASL